MAMPTKAPDDCVVNIPLAQREVVSGPGSGVSGPGSGTLYKSLKRKLMCCGNGSIPGAG